VSGDEGPLARSAQGIGAIANRRNEADAQTCTRHGTPRRPRTQQADAQTIARHDPYKEAEGGPAPKARGCEQSRIGACGRRTNDCTARRLKEAEARACAALQERQVGRNATNGTVYACNSLMIKRPKGDVRRAAQGAMSGRKAAAAATVRERTRQS
jgi:hypothetical protein